MSISVTAASRAQISDPKPGFSLACGQKRGAIMILVMLLVLLMAMMVIAVSVNTTSELSISSNTNYGRQAFIQADSALRMSVMISRIMLFPGYEDLSNFLPSSSSDLEIEVNSDDFDIALMRWNADLNSNENRYLRAGGRTTGITMDGGSTGTPLIIFKKKHSSDATKSVVVATSAVTLDYSEESLTGVSLEATSYADSSTGKRTIFVITTDGRVPVGDDSSSSEEAAFFDGSADTTHAILTTAFQEVQ
jgi:hypothetical protein